MPWRLVHLAMARHRLAGKADLVSWRAIPLPASYLMEPTSGLCEPDVVPGSGVVCGITWSSFSQLVVVVVAVVVV